MKLHLLFGAARLVFATALLGASAFAAEVGGAVPEIPFESVPNFLKLPPDMHLGEARGSRSTRRNTSSSSTAATPPDLRTAPLPRRFWSSARTANISAKSARTCMRGPTRTRCVSTKTTTSGPSTKGRT